MPAQYPGMAGTACVCYALAAYCVSTLLGEPSHVRALAV